MGNRATLLKAYILFVFFSWIQFQYRWTKGLNEQVALDIKPQPGQNSEQATVTKAQLVKEEEKKTPVSTPAKVDYATELFNLLCMDDSGGNCSKPSTDGFQCEFLLILIFFKQLINFNDLLSVSLLILTS